MSRRERIIETLAEFAGLSDREITDKVEGPNEKQQSVNQLCRKMEAEGILYRDNSIGYIRNFLVVELQEKENIIKTKKDLSLVDYEKKELHITHSGKSIKLGNYEFNYVQELKLVMDEDGNVKKFYPQSRYENHMNIPLLEYGEGAFCKFSIDSKYNGIPGVYAYFVDNEVVYIGETDNMGNRFNSGYGNISPKNCFKGGQSTNVRMNKVVLSIYENDKTIDLYFYQTHEYKNVELELLSIYNTKFNKKNN